jgi:hypothetical protein
VLEVAFWIVRWIVPRTNQKHLENMILLKLSSSIAPLDFAVHLCCYMNLEKALNLNKTNTNEPEFLPQNLGSNCNSGNKYYM